MVNQYNAANLSNVPAKSNTTNYGDGYPVVSASGIGGANSVSVTTGLQGGQKDTTAFVVDVHEDANPTPYTQDRSPKPSASGIGGGDALAVNGAFDGGTGSNKVIDHIDAPFGSNTDPYLSTDV